jgi:NhaP-type Na+/H+ and K+/H+ antiporter
MTLYIFTARELMVPGTTQVDWAVLLGLMKAFTVGWVISLIINWTLWTQRACLDLRWGFPLLFISPCPLC